MSRATPRPGAAVLALLACTAAGCAIAPPASPPPAIPVNWSAALPTGGSDVVPADWWARFEDPLLPALVDEARRNNPTLEQALQRIIEARANARLAGAASWPRLDAQASATRGNAALFTAGTPAVSTIASATLDAAWEVDLFGAARNQAAAARELAEASEAQWHGARVSLAAEVADAYVGLRTCEALLEIERAQADSLARTLDLTQQKVEAGFEAPANGALARATAADSRARVVAQRAECDVAVKQLATLTLVPEAALRERLAEACGRLPEPQAFAVPSVPAAALAQRPDLAAAERAIAAAAAEVGVAQADRYPRLQLTGSIGASLLRTGGRTLDAATWSLGPALRLPIFDAGRREAAVEAARARFEAARADWHARALAAIGEVEQALVRLDAASQRLDDAARAVQGYEEFLSATATQWEAGAGSLLDLEQARRTAQAARATLVQTQRERVASWLALYKAVGGGWSESR